MKTYPKFSVVIPTYNRANYLKRGLDAILAQGYPELELIVIDGGSTDGTVELLKSYGTRISRWLSERDGGEYFAINKGLGLAGGALIKVMTDDDVLRPGAFHHAAEFLEAHPEIDIVFGQAAVWREERGTRTFLFQTRGSDPARLSWRSWIRHKNGACSVAHFMRRGVFERVGLFATEYLTGDTEFWVRAAKAGVRMGWMPEIVVDYVYTGQNGVITQRWRLYGDNIRLNWRYGKVSDVVLAAWTYGVFKPVAHIAAKPCHAVHFHPVRLAKRLADRVAKRQPGPYL
ncbi:MAG TPA: glycosyltransferase family 2 protein [Dongiaceae bacterium]|nr:glycosyltransferase family 2 protein [Dongiaceae bacterium]